MAGELSAAGSLPSRWVLLRGLARERGHWYEFEELFARCVSPATVHPIDLPGAGDHRDAPVPLSVSGLADQVAQAMRALDAGAAFGVLGLSLGGMVALQLCAHPSPKVAMAVAINSSCRLSPPWQRLRPAALPRLLAIARLQGLARELALLALTSQLPLDRRRRYARRAALIASERPMSVLAMVRQLVAASHFEPPALGRGCRSPLLLTSSGDRLVDPDCSARLARHYAAVLRRHPSAGHDLTLDDPTWVCSQVAALLGGRLGEGSPTAQPKGARAVTAR